jgi:protein TonB
MSVAVHPVSAVTVNDRMGFTLIFAVILHVIIILGINFTFEPQQESKVPPALEVILVQTTEQKEVEKADYLAQVSHEGAGSTQEKVRPQTPPNSLLPTTSEDIVQQSLDLAPPQSLEQPIKEELLTAEQEKEKIASAQEIPDSQAKVLELSAAKLVQRSKEIANLNAEMSQSSRAYAQLPRQRFISASTKEYAPANYMEAWRRKVERVGTINYPEEAKRRQLSGSLMLDVALKPDGSVLSIKVVRSSGHKVLDDAAKRIVYLAAPFGAFPEEIRKDTDILHILRTWQFQSGGILTTR